MSSLSQSCWCKVISVTTHLTYAVSPTTRPTTTLNFSSIIRQTCTCLQTTSALIIFKTTETHSRDTSWRSINWIQRMETRPSMRVMCSCSLNIFMSRRKLGVMLPLLMINTQMSILWIRLLMDQFQEASWLSTVQRLQLDGLTLWAGTLLLQASSKLPSSRFQKPTSMMSTGTKMKHGLSFLWSLLS